MFFGGRGIGCHGWDGMWMLTAVFGRGGDRWRGLSDEVMERRVRRLPASFVCGVIRDLDIEL